jgi:hypothetical protein
VTDWQFYLQDNPTLSRRLKRSVEFGETMIALVRKASLSKKRHFVVPLILDSYSKAPS